MSKDFYKSAEYRAKQSAITKLIWRSGRLNFLRKQVIRMCHRKDCDNKFSVAPSDPKVYCSSHCAALVNSPKRTHSEETKKKIRLLLTGRKYPNRPKAPPRFSICQNPTCQKEFMWKYWRPPTNPIKYCSGMCSIKDTGSRPTSPRAARAKAGIRTDIDSKIYFFSRWEANYARLLNLQGIKWIHQPKTFRLKKQNYTPDFYLPKHDRFIEIKNFLSDYSRKRDKEFRELYPNIKLDLILKEDYLKLQEKFSSKIKQWEYS